MLTNKFNTLFLESTLTGLHALKVLLKEITGFLGSVESSFFACEAAMIRVV